MVIGPALLQTQTRPNGEVAVRQAALDNKCLFGAVDGYTAAQQDVQTLDDWSAQNRQIGQRAFAHLAVLTIGLSQQDDGRRVTVEDGFELCGVSNFVVVLDVTFQ